MAETPPVGGAGGDVDIERILSYLMSDNVTDKIVTKFDLFNHYEITSTRCESTS